MFNLLPRNPKFYDELETLSGYVTKTAGRLAQLAREPQGNGIAQEIEESEKEADEVAQHTLSDLDTSFITPIDREDIYRLVTDMQGAVETINGIAQRFGLYHFNKSDAEFVQRAGSLVKAAVELDGAIRRLRKGHELEKLGGHLRALHQIEREADKQRREFLGKLYDDRSDPIALIQRKEMHDLLERAINDCESVGKTLARVVLKNS